MWLREPGGSSKNVVERHVHVQVYITDVHLHVHGPYVYIHVKCCVQCACAGFIQRGRGAHCDPPIMKLERLDIHVF
jgi:hypothetical protein